MTLQTQRRSSRLLNGRSDGGAGCRQTLVEKVSVLSNNQINTPIYLVGLPDGDVDIVKFNKGVDHALNLSMCKSDELLECLNDKELTGESL